MIQFDNVSKSFPDGTVAAANLSFSIEPGEFVSIVGLSGAGKTTIARMIIAEEKPTEGSIVIGGWDISNIKNSEIPVLRRQIGVVFQDIKLLPARTAAENVAFAMEVGGVGNAVIARDVPKILDLVGLKDKLNAFPNELSGGEKQRIAIARALAHKPVLLIADEPTGNLDEQNAWEILQLLLKINQFGTTVLLATHATELVDRVKRRVVTLENGKIVSDQQKGKYKL